MRLQYYGSEHDSSNVSEQLWREPDTILNLTRSIIADPLSSSNLRKVADRKEHNAGDCYYGNFKRLSKARDMLQRREIPKTCAEIVRNYFANGRMRGCIPDGVHSSLIDYWGSTFLLNGHFLPCGAVRRALMASDQIRHTARGIQIGAEFPPIVLVLCRIRT